MEQNTLARARDLFPVATPKFVGVIALATILGVSGDSAQAAEENVSSVQADSAETNQSLLKRLDTMDQRMKSLEAQIKQQKTTAGGKNLPAPIENADPAKSQGKTNKPGDPSAGATLAAPSQPPTKPGKSEKPADLDKAAKQAFDKPDIAGPAQRRD